MARIGDDLAIRLPRWNRQSICGLSLGMAGALRSLTPRRAAGTAAVATLAAAALAAMVAASAPPRVTVTAVLGAACLPLSIAALVMAWRHRWAEVASLAGGLVVSATAGAALALDPGGGLRASWAPVVTAMALGAGALPLAVPATGRLFGGRWRTVLGIGALLGIGAAVVPPLPSPPEPWVRLAATVGSTLALTVAAGRLWWLYRLGRLRAGAVASAALALLAAIVVVDFASGPGDSLWWVGRLAETTAILASAVGALLLAGAPLDELLAPLAERDPFRILEVGLAPEVRALIAAVRRKDRVTRDHLVRVTQLALRVGERLPLPARRLRLLGLGALLHDIGKLVVPDAVLGKAGPLNAHEQDVMRAHAARGAELLARSPLLAPVAPIVRSHHERVDGGGYRRPLGSEHRARGPDHRCGGRLGCDDTGPGLPAGA